MYRRGGGRITDPAGFGVDPLLADTAKSEICRQSFADRVPSFAPIFLPWSMEMTDFFEKDLFSCVTLHTDCHVHRFNLFNRIIAANMQSISGNGLPVLTGSI